MQIHRISQKVAAELLQIAPRTLRDWTDAPRNADGTYSGPALVAWMLDRRGSADGFDDQRQRLAAAQAEKVEHENAVRRGELAELAVVEQFWTGCISNARARLLRAPSDAAAAVPVEHRPTVHEAVRRAVHEALAELAEYTPPK